MDAAIQRSDLACDAPAAFHAASCSPVAVLFAREDSNYKALPGCDVWDIERDALNWHGGCPVVAHPPCRAWGRLRHFARPRDGEREAADVTGRELARRMGYSAMYLCDLEHGRRGWNAKLLAAYLDALRPANAAGEPPAAGK